GDGPLEDIVLTAIGQHAIVFRTSLGKVTNLSLRQVGGDNGYAISIEQGCLYLEDCDISSATLLGIVIKNGADPRLRRNRIHNCKQAGVFVHDDGLGLLEDNDIAGNGNSGVEIKTGGNPTVRHNRIHDGKTSGVYVYDEGLGLLEDNDIAGNGNSGVEI